MVVFRLRCPLAGAGIMAPETALRMLLMLTRLQLAAIALAALLAPAIPGASANAQIAQAGDAGNSPAIPYDRPPPLTSQPPGYGTAAHADPRTTFTSIPVFDRAVPAPPPPLGYHGEPPAPVAAAMSVFVQACDNWYRSVGEKIAMPTFPYRVDQKHPADAVASPSPDGAPNALEPPPHEQFTNAMRSPPSSVGAGTISLPSPRSQQVADACRFVKAPTETAADWEESGKITGVLFALLGITVIFVVGRIVSAFRELIDRVCWWISDRAPEPASRTSTDVFGVRHALDATGLTVRELDRIVRRYAAGYRNFQEMLAEGSSYVPTIRSGDSIDQRRLADAYDAARAAQGDERRAIRLTA